MKTAASFLTVLLALLPLFSAACVSGETRQERMDSLSFEFESAAQTVRDVSAAYSAARPELSAKLASFAKDIDAVRASVDAVLAGGDSGSAFELIDSALKTAGTQVWSDDPRVQADVAVGVALARAALRRAQHELAK